MTLIAEDLLLLLLDDRTGKPVLDSTRLDRALAGAVLVELVLAERVGQTPDGGLFRRPVIVVHDGRPTGDRLLDDALATLGAKQRSAPSAVERLAKRLRERLLRRLAEAGYLREEHGAVLGIFPTTRWPALRPDHEADLRRTLSAVLVDGEEPDVRTTALVSLLTAVDAVPKVVPAADRRALVRRAEAVAEGEWAGEAVRKAVAAVHAAVTASVVAATSAGTSS